MFEFEGRQIPSEFHEIVDPKRTVLLVWDMQNDQAGGSFNKEALIRNAPPLIDAAAKAGIKTVYTRQTPFLWKDEAMTWIRRGARPEVDHRQAQAAPALWQLGLEPHGAVQARPG
jgi:nicotinamidase-related amidase